MSQLPMKIRVDIRDQFDRDESAVQKAFTNIKTIVGFSVSCRVEWPMIYNELESNFPDMSTFVPHITGLIIAWCHALVLQVEDESMEQWTETLLEKLEGVHALNLSVTTSKSERPRTTWAAQDAFVLEIPKKKPSTLLNTDTTAILLKDLATAFSKRSSIAMNRSAAPVEEPEEDDNDAEWAGVPTPSTSTAPSTAAGPIHTPTRSFSFAYTSTDPAFEPPRPHTPAPLPSLSTIPHPSALLSTPPYYLHLHIATGPPSAPTSVVIQCTHEPSLALLADYLARWTRHNPSDARQVPLLRHKLGRSNFGPGLFHHMLTIEPYSGTQVGGRWAGDVTVDVVLLLALVERVLGYSRSGGLGEAMGGGAGAGAGALWEFRRDAPFA